MPGFVPFELGRFVLSTLAGVFGFACLYAVIVAGYRLGRARAFQRFWREQNDYQLRQSYEAWMLVGGAIAERNAQAAIAELNHRDWWWGDQELDGSKPGWHQRGKPTPRERQTPVILWLLLFVAALATAICFAGSAP